MPSTHDWFPGRKVYGPELNRQLATSDIIWNKTLTVLLS
jgi:hypothetical protein